MSKRLKRIQLEKLVHNQTERCRDKIFQMANNSYNLIR